MKASDTRDIDVLRLMSTATHGWSLFVEAEVAWIGRAFMPSTPPKVIRAKMRKLISKGLVDGCACGCRGDFRLTPKGREQLPQKENHHA